eukprot:c22263_g1_i1 orf=259-507(-)
MAGDIPTSFTAGLQPGNLNQLSIRVPCPCRRCKYQIRRERHIAMQHVQENGQMERSELNVPFDDEEVRNCNHTKRGDICHHS